MDSLPTVSFDPPSAMPALREPIDRPTAAGPVLARGDVLFMAGARAGSVYRVTSGAIALSRSLPDGRRQIVDILGPGRLVGVSERVERTSTATALIRTHLRPLESVAASLLADELAVGLSRMHGHALLLGRKSALERVASGLLELAALFGSADPEERALQTSFVLPLTRTDLADWLGLVIETVSRALGTLQRRGLIGVERTDIIHLIDRPGLAALTGDRATRSGGAGLRAA